jgi:pantoate--beta-alanine ligase
MTRILTEIEQLRETVGGFLSAGDTVALVPTMGALHYGHMTLVQAARAKATRVIVSIFVNPTQFGVNEDFDRYPRTLEEDTALLRLYGVDAVWVPDVATMYPEGFATSIVVNGLSSELCGAFRPNHFQGVATVVAKLLLQVMPDIALFGEKDYQQLCIIKRMVKDLSIPCAISGVPTCREEDGLALSSRNRYLSPEERTIAPHLYEILTSLAARLSKESADAAMWEKFVAEAMEELRGAGFTKLDYLEWRSEDTLAHVTQYQPQTRLLAAAWLGNTRLIDNIVVG